MPPWLRAWCSVNLPGSGGFNTGLLASHTAHCEISRFLQCAFVMPAVSQLWCLSTAYRSRAQAVSAEQVLELWCVPGCH